MCGRFVSARERQALIDEFGVERDEVASELALDYNVAPTDSIYAVMDRAPRDQRDGPPARELHTVRWGLIPSWAKDLSGAGRLINARAETVTVKPSFRSAFARRRCLIPADGYYEWRTLDNPDGGKPRKQPYFIHRADGTGMAFAGLYELWRDQELPGDHPKAWLWTATIITTRATDEVGWVHDRMPMVISPDRWSEWLDPAPADADRLLAAMAPAASDALDTRPVSTAVNSVRNDGPDLIAPVPEVGERGGGMTARPGAGGQEADAAVDTVVSRERLQEMLDGLDRSIAVLKGENPGNGSAASLDFDPADAGANLSETDRTEAVLHSAQRQRGNVLAALGRMSEGTYGLCVDCRKPVPDGRLEARPDASRCVACQATYDRRHR